VQFHDCDPMGVVRHGNSPLLHALGRVVVLHAVDHVCRAMDVSGHDWPVVDLSIKSARPIKRLQTVEIDALIVAWENRLENPLRHLRQGLRQAADTPMLGSCGGRY
jgi:acyl-CoA thioester hydrolase